MNETKWNSLNPNGGDRASTTQSERTNLFIIPLWLWIQFEYFSLSLMLFALFRHDLSGMSLICWNEYFMRVIGALLILNTFWLRLLLWSIQDFSDAYQNDKHLPGCTLGSVQQAPLIDLWSDWGEEVLFSEKRWNRLMKLLNWWINEIQFGASQWSIESTFLSWEIAVLTDHNSLLDPYSRHVITPG